MNVLSLTRRLLAPVLMLTASSIPAAMSHAADIVPHRASYVLTLKTAKPSSGIVDVRGAMYFELGESCDGWTINQRYRLQIVSKDEIHLDTRTNFTSWESRDGLSYRFNSRTTRNGKLDQEFIGSARLPAAGEAGEAVYSKPGDRRMKLPRGSMFPTKHTVVVLERAEAGESQVWRVLFDGATEDGAFGVSAFIGRPREAARNSDLPPIANRRSWPVKLAFYPQSSDSAEPDYELSVRLNDNGVIREMVIDYGDFVLDAGLKRVEALERPGC